MKDSELGFIPKDWSVVSIPDVILKKDGIKIGPFGSQLKKELLTESGYKVYGQENVYVKDLDLGERYINKVHFEKLRSCEINSGDFLISMMGTVGKTMIVPKSFEPGIMDSHLLRLRLNESMMCPELLQHHFSSKLLLNQVMNLSVGGIMAGLSSKIIRNIILPLPSTKAEQTAIATALNDMDNLIAGLEKLIEKKKAIKQGAMQDLLRPKEGWVEVSISEICKPGGIVRGPFGGALKKECFVESGYKVYEQRNAIYQNIELGNYFITQSKFMELKRFEVQNGDFIISCSGTIGKIFQIPEQYQKGIINQALLKITIDTSKYSDRYFYHYFSWDKFQAIIIDSTQGGAMKNLIGMPEFKRTIIPMPARLKEQKEIADVFSNMDKEVFALEKRLLKFRHIKKGIMQELLTGKTRLV